MEESTFILPEVSRELEKMIEARLHVDRPSPFKERILELQQKLTGVTSLPYYLVLDPRTDKVLARRSGATSASNFAKILREGLGEEPGN